MKRTMNTAGLRGTAILFAVMFGATEARSDLQEVTISIQNHQFTPHEVVVPAGTKVRLNVINQDPTAEEFESYELRREKVIPGGASAKIIIGPLEPGEYPFFGEFNPATAQGRVVALENMEAGR